MGPDWLKETDFAHRGLHGLSDGCPENSLAAIEEAVKHGYGIEIDVQRSADYEAIVFHDTNLKRLTNSHGPVASRQSSELCRTELTGSTEKIPTLKQVLDVIGGRTPLLIEIKSSPGPGVPGVLEQRVASLLESYKGPVAAMALSPNPIAWLGLLSPHTPLGNVVTKVHRASVLPGLLRSATKVVRRLGAGAIARSDFVAIDLNILEQCQPDEIRQKGKPVLAWTVTSETQAAETRDKADALIFESFKPKDR
jgi:glycerophosphoryl diester phosphodiesterase